MSKRKRMVWMALGFLLLPVVLLAGLSIFSRRPANLGVRNGRLAPCPETPNCVSSRAGDTAHRIEPLRFPGDPGTALRHLEAALATLPRLQVVTVQEGYLHLEARSRLFRFVDDVEFQVDPGAGLIHVRSASRAGHSDLGANRARVEAIREAFDRHGSR